MNLKKSKKERATFTLSPETIKRLEKYAYENHTNKSQAITNLIWNAKLKEERE